jgi:hypothetical protein
VTRSLVSAPTWISRGACFLDIDDFSDTQPTMKLEEFFSGRIQGWGYTMTRLGALQNQFKIDAEANWDPVENVLSLNEVYQFDDGHEDRIDWSIRRLSESRYEGREAAIDGVAIGDQQGNAFNWQYSREVPEKDGSVTKLTFDDWFWLQSPNVMVAFASIQKFGIEVARLSAFYIKSDEPIH